MANLKVLEAVSALSSEEEKEFREFLASPFFVQKNEAEAMSRLFQFALAALKHQRAEPIDRASLHAHVFPDKPYSDARLERAITKFVKLVEQFLLVKNYLDEDRSVQRAIDLASIYRQRRLTGLYEKNMQKIKKMSSEVKQSSTEIFLMRYQIASEEYEWRQTFNKAKGDLSAPELIQSLDMHYHAKRLEVFNSILLQQKVMDAKSLKDFWPVTRANDVVKQLNAKYPMFTILKKINSLLLMSEPDEKETKELIDLIMEHESEFDEETVKMFYTYARGFCSILHTNGRLEFANILHKLHRINLEKGHFHYGGQITPHSLLNLTVIAILTGNFEWAKNTVETNRHKVLSDVGAEDVYLLNLALCQFEEKKYEEALQNITFQYPFFVYMLFAKRLELRIYYEMRSELLFHKMDAFRKYVERSAHDSYYDKQLMSCINFVKFLSQLSRAYYPTPEWKERLIKRINEKKQLADRVWLLKKAMELSVK